MRISQINHKIEVERDGNLVDAENPPIEYTSQSFSNSTNVKAYDHEKAKVSTIMNENKEMDELTPTQTEQIPEDGPTAPYAKRSNVAAQWRKREEAIKAANVKARERTRDIDFEEKKKAGQDLEEKGKTESAMQTPDSNAVASPTTDMGSYKRSNIRDSWKKKAATSPYSSQQSPSIPESPSNANSAAFDELKNKWKKFGVQNEGDAKPESGEKQIIEAVETEVKSDIKQTAETNRNENVTESSKPSLSDDRVTKGSRAAVARRMGSSRFKSRFDRSPQTPSKTDEKSSNVVEPTTENKVKDDPFSNAFDDKEWSSFDNKGWFPTSAFSTDQETSNDAPKSPLSPAWQVEATPASPNSGVSNTSLSSRASRRLRDIRARKQALKKGEEPDKIEATDSDDKPLPMEESTDQRPKTSAKSPLHGIVPSSMEEIVPYQFFSEKDSHIDSFKAVLSNTSFGQIANDIREEASTIFELSIVNEGVQSLQSTLNSWGFGDFFSSDSPEKTNGRPASPVEEVAVEVEYVADPEE